METVTIKNKKVHINYNIRISNIVNLLEPISIIMNFSI